MRSRVLASLNARTALRERRFVAFTLIEAIVVLLIVGILLGIAAVSFGGVQRGQLDKAGYPILGAAQVDARRVASSQGLTFPTQTSLLSAMANSATTADGRSLSYQSDPSPDNGHVSVARGDAVTAGFAVMTSMQGSWEDGSANDGHCLLSVDSLKGGTTYATMTDAIRGGTNYCGASFAVACKATMTAGTLPGSGTADDPYVLSSTASCPTTPVSSDPVAAPTCVVAEPMPATDGVSTRSARITWVPAANTETAFTYLVEATGPSTVDSAPVDAGARTVILDGLNPGGLYTFHVYAVNAAGTKFGPTDSNQLLLVPGNPAVTTTALPGELDLAWPQVPGAQTYEITRTPSFTTGPATKVVNDASAVNGQVSYADTDVTAGTQYAYTVTAVTAQQAPVTQCAITVTGGGRAPTSWQPPPTPLPAPTLTVTPAATGFSLSWTAVTNADHYVVRSSSTSAAYVPTTNASVSTLGTTPAGGDNVTATTFSDTISATGANRWVTYQVGAVDVKGTVTWSNTDAGLLAPDQPVINSVAPNAGNPTSALDVAWSSVATATGYTLTRGGVGVGGTLGASATGYTDTGLSSGASYSYVLTASNVQTATINGASKTVGGTTASAPVSGATQPAAGDLTVTADNTNRYFNISWATIAGATAYQVDGTSDGTNWFAVPGTQTTSGGKVSLVDTAGGTGFGYGQVRAYRMTATGSGTSYAKAVAAALAPAYPTLTATPAAPAGGTSTVALAGAATGATDITLTDTAGNPVPATVKAAAGGITFTASEGGQPLAQWVKYSAKAKVSTTLSVAAFGPYPATTLTATSDSSQAPLPTTSTGPVCPSAPTTVGVAYPQSATATTPGCQAFGNGYAYSTAVTPTLVKTVTGRHALTLTWTGVQALSAYKVYRATGQNVAVPTTGTPLNGAGGTSGTSYTDGTTANGTWYSYVVVPVTPSGVATAASAASAGLTVPNAPTVTLTNAARDAMRITFTQVPSATAYIVVPAGPSPDPTIDPLTLAGGAAALPGLGSTVLYWGGPKQGTQSIAVSGTGSLSVVAYDLPMEANLVFNVYAVNASGLSDAGSSARCTAPNPPAVPTQDLTYRAKYGNQITLNIPTRNTACIKQFVITRTDPWRRALTTKTDSATVTANGTTFRYTAAPVPSGVTMTFDVVAKGPGGASTTVTAKANAFSSYDLLVQAGNPDLYYTFDEGPGSSVVKNCANADCSVQASADVQYNLGVSSPRLPRPASPLAGSGYDPTNYSALFTNSAKINAVNHSYKWPGANYTMESWVYLTSANQVGVIVGWGDQNCESGSRTMYTCNGGFLGLGGEGTSTSSGATYFGYSAGVWGRALLAANTFKTNLNSGPTGGTRLDPNAGENANVAMTANMWHLVDYTVDYKSNGLTYLRHWVDGRALGDCYYSNGQLKYGSFATDDTQWCTVWQTTAFSPSTDYFNTHPSLEGVSVGGFSRIAFNGNIENRYLQAQIDDVAVYPSVLSPTTMRQHYLLGKLFFSSGNDTQDACVAAPGCFDLTGSFTGGGTLKGSTRVYTVRDTGSVSAAINGALFDGSTKMDSKNVALTATLQVQDADGDWVNVATDNTPTVNGNLSQATYSFSGITWSAPGTYQYRVVAQTGYGQVYGASMSLNVGP